jgi:hypothetical protein
MPTRTRFDHAARLVYLEAHGNVSPAEAVTQMRELCAELADLRARCPGGPYGVLLDTTCSDTVPRAADILGVLGALGAGGAPAHTGRWACLATELVHFGMGRLFGAHAEARGLEVRVFTTREEAMAWLLEARTGADA